MAWMTGKVQCFSREGSKDHSTGDCPYFKQGEKFFLKTTGAEVRIIEQEIDVDRLLATVLAKKETNSKGK